MFSKSLAVLAGSMLAASPAAAADQSTNKAPITRVQEKTYCIQLEPFTGSRLSRTKCMTKKQWELEGVDVDELLAK